MTNNIYSKSHHNRSIIKIQSNPYLPFYSIPHLPPSTLKRFTAVYTQLHASYLHNRQFALLMHHLNEIIKITSNIGSFCIDPLINWTTAERHSSTNPGASAKFANSHHNKRASIFHLVRSGVLSHVLIPEHVLREPLCGLICLVRGSLTDNCPPE